MKLTKKKLQILSMVIHAFDLIIYDLFTLIRTLVF